MAGTAKTTPISTYGVRLMYYNAGAYKKLCDIKTFSDIGGTPETLETTTTSDPSTTFILGIQQLEAFTFETNYISGDYTKIKGMKDTLTDFAIFFGSDKKGADGTFYFSGYVDVAIAGGGVNEVINMNITIAPTTEVSQTAPTHS